MVMRIPCLLAVCAAIVLTAECGPANATLKTCGGPLVQAHRAGCGEYQDNSVGGLKWCLAKGVRGLEFDVRFTKDRHLVIMHDNHIDRTTNGKGWAEDKTLEELRKFRLNMCGEPVPTLEEMLEPLHGRRDFFAEVEMKVLPCPRYPRERIAEYCVQLYSTVTNRLEPGTYIFTCFDIRTLRIMRATVPSAPLGYIIVEKMSEKHLDEAKALNCCSIAPIEVSKELVDRAHAEGLSVCMWMGDTIEDYARFKALGADRVTSDYPVLLTRAASGVSKKVVAVGADVLRKMLQPSLSERNRTALKELGRRYSCVAVGLGESDGSVVDGVRPLGFDVAACQGNYHATAVEWARRHGCDADDVVYVGDDFLDDRAGGSVRKNGMDGIVLTNHERFWYSVRILTN